MKRFVLSVFWVLLIQISMRAQSHCRIVIPSANGYSVITEVKLQSIVPSSTVCPWGYNYNVALTYTIEYIGSPIPGNMFTLQGDFTSGTGYPFTFLLPTAAVNVVGSYTTGNTAWVSSNGNNVYTTNPSCTAANVTNMGLGNIKIYAGGPGMMPTGTYLCNSFSFLPIELVDFSIRRQSKKTILNWETASEKNAAFFEIEKSENGVDWSAIGKIQAMGNSSKKQNYSFNDETSINKLSYYRLKQVDLDSSYVYSKIISLESQNVEMLSSWPNPAPDFVNVELVVKQSAAYHYKILNDLGLEVLKGDYWLPEGQHSLQVNIADLPSGCYTMVWRNAGNQITQKKLLKG